MKRIGVFVDLSNLYYCTTYRHNGRKVDYRKYLEYCREIGEVTHAHAYGSQVNDQARAFIRALEKIGFTPKYKEPKLIKTSRGVIHKADWDVGMTIDVINIILGVGLDMIVLGSADGDMHPLVSWLEARGVQVLVLASGISFELKNATPRCVEIPESLLE
jgi:uncharacterized LabA/DUF88 family protein